MKLNYNISSFFKVKEPFLTYEKGDILFLNNMVHWKVVKLGTAIHKTKYIDYSSCVFKIEFKDLIESCNHNELKRRRPHLTKRIRWYCDYEFKLSIPISICKDCGLKGNPKLNDCNPIVLEIGKCGVCGKRKELSLSKLFGDLQLEGFR